MHYHPAIRRQALSGGAETPPLGSGHDDEQDARNCPQAGGDIKHDVHLEIELHGIVSMKLTGRPADCAGSCAASLRGSG